jgi:hypothetical protein
MAAAVDSVYVLMDAFSRNLASCTALKVSCLWFCMVEVSWAGNNYMRNGSTSGFFDFTSHEVQEESR